MAGKKSTSYLNNQHHSTVDYSIEYPLPLRTRPTAVNTAAVDKNLNTNINIELTFSNSAMLNTWNPMRTNDMSIVFDMTSPHNVPEVKFNQINVWPLPPPPPPSSPLSPPHPQPPGQSQEQLQMRLPQQIKEKLCQRLTSQQQLDQLIQQQQQLAEQRLQQPQLQHDIQHRPMQQQQIYHHQYEQQEQLLQLQKQRQLLMQLQQVENTLSMEIANKQLSLNNDKLSSTLLPQQQQLHLGKEIKNVSCTGVTKTSMNNENEESFEEKNCTAAANIVAHSHNLDTHESQNNTLTQEEKEVEVNADHTKSKSSSDLTLEVVENFDAAGVINNDNANDNNDADDNEINDNGEDHLSQNSNDSSIIYVSSSNAGTDEELKGKTTYQGNNNETSPMTTLSESKHVNHNKRKLDDAISTVSKKHTIDIISSHSVFPPSSSLLSINNNLPSPSTSNSLPKPVADIKSNTYVNFQSANSRIIDERQKKTIMPVFDRVREGCSFCRHCSCEIYAVNEIFFDETKNNFDMPIYALKLPMFFTNTFTPQPFAPREVCQVYSDSTNEKLNCSQLFQTPNNSPGNFAFVAVTVAMTNKSYTPKPDWNICFNACLCDYNIVFPSKRNLRSMNNNKAKCDLYIGLFSLDDDFFIQINLKKFKRITEKYPDFQLRLVPCPEIKKHESISVRVKKSTLNHVSFLVFPREYIHCIKIKSPCIYMAMQLICRTNYQTCNVVASTLLVKQDYNLLNKCHKIMPGNIPLEL